MLYFVSFEDGPQPREQLSEKDIALAKIKAIKEEERRGPRYSKLQVLAIFEITDTIFIYRMTYIMLFIKLKQYKKTKNFAI